MSNNHDDNRSEPLLDEIRWMFQKGDRENALELIDLYLLDYTDDLDAELLKVEICLELERGVDYIGETLARWDADISVSEAICRLRQRVEKRVIENLAQGRRKLERDYVGDAIEYFKTASSLLPNDPTVTLSAALALIGDEQLPYQTQSIRERVYKKFSRNSESTSHDRRLEVAGQYLQLTLERSGVNLALFNKAANLLICLWLSQGAVRKVLNWLKDNKSSALETELMATVAQSAFATALYACMALLRNDQQEEAQTILAICQQLNPDVALLHLLWAELWKHSQQSKKAIVALRKVLTLGDANPVEIEFTSLQRVWSAVEDIRIICPECGRRSQSTETRCEFCTADLKRSILFLDQFDLRTTPEPIIAHAALADLLMGEFRQEEASEHIDIALQFARDNPDFDQTMKILREKQELLAHAAGDAVTKAQSLASAIKCHGLTITVAKQVQRTCTTKPLSWLDLSFWDRFAVARELVDMEYFDAAGEFIDAAFADNPGRKTVMKLQRDLRICARAMVQEIAVFSGTGTSAQRF